MKYLEAVTVCVDYSDLLTLVIPTNKQLFEKWVIVTSPLDKRTQEVCHYFNLECVTTTCFYDNGDSFNKGKAINEGFKRLTKRGWVLHLDADIMLPYNTRRILKEEQLQKDAIYGIDRVDVIGQDQILKLMSTQGNQIEDWIFLNKQKLAEEYRFSPQVFHEKNGNNAIGFFQLWHADNHRPYPTEHSTAARTDVQFCESFPQDKRLHYPGVVGYHLMSEDSPMSANWAGRTSKMVYE